MRTIYKGVSFLALVNLLALAMIVAWMWRTDRLDRGRIEQVRAIFATTISESGEQDLLAAEAAEAERARRAAEAKRQDPPWSSAAQDRQITRVRQQELLARRRLDDERRLLMDGIASQTQEVQQREAELVEARQAWEAATDDERSRSAEAQLVKAVQQLESIPPKQAKAIIVELVGTGRLAQAVAYLDRMGRRPLAKVLREFKSAQDTALATRLLEELRQLGRIDGNPEERDGANPSTAD